MVFCGLWLIGDWLNIFLICRHLAYTWDKFIIKRKCGDLATAYLGSQTTNLAFDLSITMLPIPALWRLQTRTWKSKHRDDVWSGNRVRIRNNFFFLNFNTLLTFFSYLVMCGIGCTDKLILACLRIRSNRYTWTGSIL